MKSIDKKLWKNFDWPIMLFIVILVACSLIFIANAQAEPFTGQESTLEDYMSHIDMTLVWLQLMWFGIGLAVVAIILVMDYHSFRDLAKIIYFINLVLLALLFLLSRSIRGTTGWFIIGDRGFQPAEVCKITLIIMTAKIASEAFDRDGSLKSIKDLMHILAYAVPPIILVMLQPDWGTAIVFIMIVVSILFAAKMNFKKFLVLITLGVAALPFSYFFLMQSWQRRRIDVFLKLAEDLNPDWHYNVAQSVMAIGSGGLTGKGIFAQGALSQLNFVPEKHTDFIFSVIVEAVGFVGGIAILLVYFLLIIRCLYLATKAKDSFGSFLIVGVVGMISFHIFENISMTMDLVPVTGIPLPFMSYGGSSFITNMIAFGLVLNVALRRPQKRHLRMGNTAIDLE